MLPCLTPIACVFVWMDKCSLSDILALIAGFHHLIKSCYLLELACESCNYMYILLPCLTHIACDFVWMDKCSLSDISALIAGFHHLIKSCYLLELACESCNYMYMQNW